MGLARQLPFPLARNESVENSALDLEQTAETVRYWDPTCPLSELSKQVSPPFQGGVARSAGAVGQVAKHPCRYPRSAPYGIGGFAASIRWLRDVGNHPGASRHPSLNKEGNFRCPLQSRRYSQIAQDEGIDVCRLLDALCGAAGAVAGVRIDSNEHRVFACLSVLQGRGILK